MSIFDDKRKQKKQEPYQGPRYREAGAYGTLVTQASGSGGAALTIREVDAAPTVNNVTTIVVSNGTLTDNGGGQVTLTIGGSGLADPGGNGIVVRTALNTTINRTLTGTANRVVITNGDGVAGNPTFDVGSLVAINTNRIDQNNIGPTTSAQLAGVISDETGTGALVFATSPTLVTPALGTPSSGTLTNTTGFPVANLAGAGAGVLTFLATPTSANLAAALTDETGTGANVFATSPTLVTPALGTPSSGTLTNTTGFPVANLAGAGAGVLTFLATPSSANLLAAVTDETGTSLLVFNTSPTLVTPRINQINDSNGNELIIFTTTASAINELTIANAAAGNNPTTNPTGGDTNIGWTSTMKGTGSRLIIAGAAGGTPLIARSAASPTADIFIADANASATAQFAVSPDGYYRSPSLKTLTADVNVTADATVNDVTDLLHTLRSGRTYKFKAVLFMQAANTTIGLRVALSGTATATAIRSVNILMDDTVNTFVNITVDTALDVDFIAVGDTNQKILFMDGVITVNAGGTFVIGFAQQTSGAGNSTMQRGSFFEVIEKQ